MNKLTAKCRICNRYMILYGYQELDLTANRRTASRFDKAIKDLPKAHIGEFGERYEAQGPKSFPKIKKWCHGHCNGIVAELDMLVGELVAGKSAKRKEWAYDLRDDIEKTIIKLIKDLASGKKSC